MTDSGLPPDGDATPDRSARTWLRTLLSTWDTDPDLVQSMPREDVIDELGDAARDDLGPLQTWAETVTAAPPEQQDHATEHAARPASASTASVPPGDTRRTSDRPSRSRPNRSASPLRLASAPSLQWAAGLVGILVVAYGLLWGIGQATQPDVHALASLDGHAGRLDAVTAAPPPLPTKDAAALDASVYASDVRAGIALLRASRTTTLGLFPRYRTSDVALGIATLERAYASRPPAAPRGGSLADDEAARPSAGTVAFLIGKGYLMLDEPARARLWFRRALDHTDSTWHPEAKRLLNALPPD